MRDTNENMIEIVGVSDDKYIFSSTVRFILENEQLTVTFGIDEVDIKYIKKIIEFRPFEHTGVARYKYFFALGGGKLENDLAKIDVRVEQLNNHKQFDFTVTRKYLSNLWWFYEVKDKDLLSSYVVNTRKL